MTVTKEIRRCIEKKLDEGFTQFIIYPLGDIGIQVKQILNTMYGIQENYIIDNHRCKYNPQIKGLPFLESINCKDYCLILACINPDIYEELRLDATKYFPEENIAELYSMKNRGTYLTQIGKYSYGPLCEGYNMLIETIGAFCSFATGTAVVTNHEQRYVTTSPLIYHGAHEPIFRKFSEFYR